MRSRSTFGVVVGRAVLVASIVALALAGVAPAAAQNLVTNGSFSSGTTGWNWHALSGVETCCASPPGGYPNAYAHPDGAGGSGVWGYIVPWQNIADNQAGTYTLSGKIRTSGGVQEVWIQADNGDFFGTYCQTAHTNTTYWQTFSCTFTLYSPATIHVALAASNAPATAWGWIAWDDISLTRSGGTTSYDLAQYMMRTDGQNGPIYALHNSQGGSETMQIQYSGGKYYQVKNSHWEEFSYDGSYVWRFRDTSLNETDWYGLYRNCPSCILGDPWAQRYMTIGQSRYRVPRVRMYNSSCGMYADYDDPSTIKLEGAWGTYSVNGYNLSNVILLRSYRSNGTKWEDYYYARGIGLIEFRAWDEAGNDVFHSWYDGPRSGTLTREWICTP